MHESILNLCPIEFNAQLVVMNAPARADNAMVPGVVSGRAHARSCRVEGEESRETGAPVFPIALTPLQACDKPARCDLLPPFP